MGRLTTQIKGDDPSFRIWTWSWHMWDSEMHANASEKLCDQTPKSRWLPHNVVLKTQMLRPHSSQLTGENKTIAINTQKPKTLLLPEDYPTQWGHLAIFGYCSAVRSRRFPSGDWRELEITEVLTGLLPLGTFWDVQQNLLLMFNRNIIAPGLAFWPATDLQKE